MNSLGVSWMFCSWLLLPGHEVILQAALGSSHYVLDLNGHMSVAHTTVA